MPTAYPIYSQPLMAKLIMARAMDTNERPSDSPLPEPIKEFNFLRGVLPAGLTYTNSSTERVYWDSTGTRRSAVANEPIFETLGGVAQGMRWEMEQRQNLATNSEGAAATWSVSNVTDAGTPIAGFSASLQFGDNSVQRSARKVISHTIDLTYTLSVFIQMDDGLAPALGTSASTGDFYLYGPDGGICTLNPTVTLVTGSLYRVSAGRTALGTASTLMGPIKATGQSARTFRIIGLQVETAASASSYIPTAGSAVTRQPDVLTATSISPWYRQDEGTILFEGIDSRSSSDSGAYGYAIFSDGTDANRITTRRSGLLANLAVVTASAIQASMNTANAYTAGSIFRAASAYQLNNFAVALNGGSAATDAGGTVPTVTALTLGQGNGAGTQAWMGYARRLSYYNTRLPNAIIQGLSRV